MFSIKSDIRQFIDQASLLKVFSEAEEEYIMHARKTSRKSINNPSDV